MDVNKIKKWIRNYLDMFKPQPCPFCGDKCITYWMKLRIEGNGKAIKCHICNKQLRLSKLFNVIATILKFSSYISIPIVILITQEYMSGVIVLICIILVLSFIATPFSRIEYIENDN